MIQPKRSTLNCEKGLPKRYVVKPNVATSLVTPNSSTIPGNPDVYDVLYRATTVTI